VLSITPPALVAQATPIIHAQLTGDDRCSALGITARSGSPVLKLCKLLVNSGHDPSCPLHCYRGEVLALRSIGEGATLVVSGTGKGFVKRSPHLRRGSLVSGTVGGGHG
jgi:hypothetical protein